MDEQERIAKARKVLGDLNQAANPFIMARLSQPAEERPYPMWNMIDFEKQISNLQHALDVMTRIVAMAARECNRS